MPCHAGSPRKDTVGFARIVAWEQHDVVGPAKAPERWAQARAAQQRPDRRVIAQRRPVDLQDDPTELREEVGA